VGALAPSLIAAGLGLALLGVLIARALERSGHLAGDARIERDHVRRYVPVTSMPLVSVCLSGVTWAIRRWFG